jgi:hypothetical protein
MLSVKVKVNQSLDKPNTGEGSRMLRIPDFEKIGT